MDPPVLDKLNHAIGDFSQRSGKRGHISNLLRRKTDAESLVMEFQCCRLSGPIAC